MSKNYYEVVIIGAGPAGNTCAIQLLRAGVKKVLLIESGNFEKFRIGESIPPDANQLFHQMGIYEEFIQQKHSPCYGSCSSWGSEEAGFNDFILNKNGYGWHLDRTKFNRFLAEKAVSLGATLYTKTTFQKAEKQELGGFEIQIKDAEKESIIFADLVVDASGSRSVFAQAQGQQQLNTESLVCLSMRFAIKETGQKFSKMTHLEGAENGWWYAAQIPNNQLLVALYTDAEMLKKQKLNTSETWLAALETTRHIHNLRANMELVDARPKGFAAPSFILNETAGTDWLAIGDAASAYDPITAQGIMKSMLTAFFAAQTIVQKLEGTITDFKNYDAYIQYKYKQYLNMRRHLYQLEKRWDKASFWKKMQQEGVLNTV